MIDKPGKWKQRNGETAIVERIGSGLRLDESYPVKGASSDGTYTTWSMAGSYCRGAESSNDLVEFIEQ